jgi:hypothetical protein
VVAVEVAVVVTVEVAVVVVVGEVVWLDVTVVVGVVDSSSIARTNTLVSVTSPDIVIPAFVICVAAVARSASSSSL